MTYLYEEIKGPGPRHCRVCYIGNILKARFSQDELISLCQNIVEFQEKKHNEF